MLESTEQELVGNHLAIDHSRHGRRGSETDDIPVVATDAGHLPAWAESPDKLEASPPEDEGVEEGEHVDHHGQQQALEEV